LPHDAILSVRQVMVFYGNGCMNQKGDAQNARHEDNGQRNLKGWKMTD